MRIAADLRLSPMICNPKVPATLHPHHVRLLWVITVEVGHHSTTPHMWVTATSNVLNYAHKPQTSLRMVQVRHTTQLLPLPSPRTLPPPPPIHTRAILPVGFSPSKTSLLSRPYLRQNTPSNPPPMCHETRRTSTTMVRRAKRP